MIKSYSSIDFLNEVILKMYKSHVKVYEKELWNKKYESINFNLNGVSFKSRLANKTPNKDGYFVSIWTKDEVGKNRPFNFDEFQDKLIINILDKSKKGQFVFTKEILAEKGIISSEKNKGKMAIRIYPSWEKDLNNTAYKTQQWQLDYFLDFSNEVNNSKLKNLYGF